MRYKTDNLRETRRAQNHFFLKLFHAKTCHKIFEVKTHTIPDTGSDLSNHTTGKQNNKKVTSKVAFFLIFKKLQSTNLFKIVAI